jgi:hypothetical protein
MQDVVRHPSVITHLHGVGCFKLVASSAWCKSAMLQLAVQQSKLIGGANMTCLDFGIAVVRSCSTLCCAQSVCLRFI